MLFRLGEGGVLTLVFICCKTTDEWGSDHFFFSLVTMADDNGFVLSALLFMFRVKD